MHLVHHVVEMGSAKMVVQDLRGEDFKADVNLEQIVMTVDRALIWDNYFYFIYHIFDFECNNFIP